MLMSVTWMVGNLRFLLRLDILPLQPSKVGHAQPPLICPEGISQTDISDTNLTVSQHTGISESYPTSML